MSRILNAINQDINNRNHDINENIIYSIQMSSIDVIEPSSIMYEPVSSLFEHTSTMHEPTPTWGKEVDIIFYDLL